MTLWVWGFAFTICATTHAENSSETFRIDVQTAPELRSFGDRIQRMGTAQLEDEHFIANTHHTPDFVAVVLLWPENPTTKIQNSSAPSPSKSTAQNPVPQTLTAITGILSLTGKHGDLGTYTLPILHIDAQKIDAQDNRIAFHQFTLVFLNVIQAIKGRPNALQKLSATPPTPQTLEKIRTKQHLVELRLAEKRLTEPHGKFGGPTRYDVEIILRALVDANQNLRDRARSTLSLHHQTIASGLLSALQSKNWRVRQMAARELGPKKEMRESSVEPLLTALGDYRWEVRREAAISLGKIADGHATKALLKTLRDIRPEVRCEAAWALGRLHDHTGINALLKAAKDPNQNVRRKAVEALGLFDDSRVTQALQHAQKDRDPGVQNAAKQALAHKKTRR